MQVNEQRVLHLFQRAGFGAGPAEVARWAGAGTEAAVEQVLRQPAEPELIAPPDLGQQEFDPERLVDIQAWWLHRMATTRHPLVEKMTLFWHGHFATGVRKAKPALMQRQNELLRSHALGAFPELLRAMGTDGAMLLWLDGHGSQKKAPNENYAREVMELFTTGPGPYTEQDVQEAARAFTGWRINRESLEVRFFPQAHDGGEKRVLGQTGRFRADDVAAILAARPETPRFLAAKLWRFFASPVPDADVVEAMAVAYESSGGQIVPMLRTLFRSEPFYASAGALVRCPADLVASTYRLLGLPVGREAAGLCISMGQSLYDPPNVAGWPGGQAWLGASTLLNRWNLGEAVRARWVRTARPEAGEDLATPRALVEHWLGRLAVPAVSESTWQALLALVGERLPDRPQRRLELTGHLIRTIIATPEYQTT